MEQTKGLKIENLVQQLESQALRKHDMIIPSDALSMQDGQLKLNYGSKNEYNLAKMLESQSISVSNDINLDTYEVLDICHNQIADKLEIPHRYYQKMRSEAVEILDQNVTGWLKRARQNYFLRTFASETGGNNIARAFLSDRYKVIDNLDVLLSALEAIQASGKNIKIQDCDLTDKKMYVRFIAPDVVLQAPELLKNYKVPNKPENDGNSGICTGFILTNSETGHGTFSISPRITILACQNGMIRHDEKTARTHLGSRMETGIFKWSQATKIKEMELIQYQVKDAINYYLSEEYLGKVIDDMTAKGLGQLKHPVDAIQNISQALFFSEERKKELLSFFVQSGDTSNFGAVQSLTYIAQDFNPDDRYDLEKASVGILDNIGVYDRPYLTKTAIN